MGDLSIVRVGAGEINTASNTGTAGTGVFKQKVTYDLEFYKLNSVNNKITIALDGTDKIDFTLVEGNINHDALTNFEANEHFLEGSISHLNITNIGTQTHAQLETAIGLNTAKDTNVTTNLSLGVGNATTEVIACSDGTDVTLIEADTDNAGLLGANKWDEIVANSIHTADNTQAHSDYLLNSGVDVGVGLTLTGDNSSADTQYTAQVLYNTDDTPPSASNFPIGTIYIQYTA